MGKKNRLGPGHQEISSLHEKVPNSSFLRSFCFKSIRCLLLLELGYQTTVHQRSGPSAIATWLVPTVEIQA